MWLFGLYYFLSRNFHSLFSLLHCNIIILFQILIAAFTNGNFFSFFEILFYAQFPQVKVWYWVLIWYFSWKNGEKWNVRVRENMKQKFRGLLEFQQQVDFFEDQVLFPCHMSGDVTDNWKKKCEGPFPVFVTVPWLQFQTTKKNCIQCLKINKKLCQIIEVNCSFSQWSFFYSLW